MAALATAAAWLCAVTLGSVAVEADVRLTARGREVRVEGSSPRSTAELELVPRLALLRHGRLELSLSYAPRLTLPVDLSAGAPELRSASALRDRTEVVHEGGLVLETAATPRLSLRLRGDGGYGRLDPLRSEIYAADVLPATGRLAWRSARASLEATATPSSRTTLAGALRAFDTGGADATAREVLPLQRGALLETSLRRAASRRDEVSLALAVSYTRFTTATEPARAGIVRLGGGWAHLLGPTLAARTAAGAAWTRSDRSGVAAVRELGPFAELGVSHSPVRPPVTTEVALRLTPYVSPLDGTVSQRLEGTASTRWRASLAWELAARAAVAATRSETSHGVPWTGARAAELGSAALGATWTFARRGTLSFGPRLRWQQGHAPALPTFVEWGAAGELTLGARWPG